MTSPCEAACPVRHLVFAMLLAVPFFLSGCSQDQDGFEDVHMPASVSERFPIEAVKRPLRLEVAAAAGRLSSADANLIAGFATVARRPQSSTVTISYAPDSRYGRKVASQAAALLVEQGLPRTRIRTAADKGKADKVSLSMVAMVAATKPCGDWSENLANNFANRPYPNMGCAMQNNIAAMVSNPEDLAQPRGMPSAQSAARSPSIKTHESNEWTKPTVTFGDLSNSN